jgi:hypothetical protein
MNMLSSKAIDFSPPLIHTGEKLVYPATVIIGPFTLTPACPSMFALRHFRG